MIGKAETPKRVETPNGEDDELADDTSPDDRQERKPDVKIKKSFIGRVQNNINFIENALQCYPIPEKPIHCSEQNLRIKPERKQILEETENDNKSVADSRSASKKKKKGSKFLRKLKRVMSSCFIKDPENDDNAASLPASTTGLKISESTSSVNGNAGDNEAKKAQRIAKANKKALPRKNLYKMKYPYKSVCNSRATRTHLTSSLEKYRDWLKAKQSDVNYKSEIEKVMRSVKDSIDESASPENVEGENETIADEPKDETEKSEERKTTLPHTTRLLRNMELLKKTLNEMPPPVEDDHMKSHRKFLSSEQEEPKKSLIDEENLIRMAEPTKSNLLATFERYRKLMSKDKQNRIELQLGLKTDELTSLNGKLPETPVKSKQVDEAALLQQIEAKITTDVLDEIANRLTKKIPKLITKRKEPLMMTSKGKALQDHALIAISNYRAPEWEHELPQYRRLAELVGDFVAHTMTDSLYPKKKKGVTTVKPLKSLQKNEDLIKFANSLIAKHI